MCLEVKSLMWVEPFRLGMHLPFYGSFCYPSFQVWLETKIFTVWQETNLFLLYALQQCHSRWAIYLVWFSSLHLRVLLLRDATCTLLVHLHFTGARLGVSLSGRHDGDLSKWFKWMSYVMSADPIGNKLAFMCGLSILNILVCPYLICPLGPRLNWLSYLRFSIWSIPFKRRIGCALWWSMSTVENSLFICRRNASLERNDRDSMERKSFWRWLTFTNRTSFTGISRWQLLCSEYVCVFAWEYLCMCVCIYYCVSILYMWMYVFMCECTYLLACIYLLLG